MTRALDPGNSSTRPFRPVSMTDVASHAGVSQKTVSRVVNNEPHVRSDLRERVAASIAELGFRPNAAARALVSQRSRRIGMITIGTTLHGPSSIILGVENAARANGYFLSMVRSDGYDVASLQAAIDTLVSQSVEAIVISEPMELGPGDVQVPKGVEVLTFGSRPFTGSAAEFNFGVDEAGGARSATEHLLALGHETVWHIAGPADWFSSRQRIRGWHEALEDADASVPPTVEGDWSPQSGYDTMKSIVHRTDITAVFVANDQMAIGAMAALQATGLRVPLDVSIVGFDDISTAAFLTVPLTTIRQDLDEATRLGMHRLFRTLEGHPPSERHRLIPVQLIPRATTSAPNPERRRIQAI